MWVLTFAHTYCEIDSLHGTGRLVIDLSLQHIRHPGRKNLLRMFFLDRPTMDCKVDAIGLIDACDVWSFFRMWIGTMLAQ